MPRRMPSPSPGGRVLTERFAFGVSAKLITEQIWHSQARGLALDLGTVFVTPFRGNPVGGFYFQLWHQDGDGGG